MNVANPSVTTQDIDRARYQARTACIGKDSAVSLFECIFRCRYGFKEIPARFQWRYVETDEFQGLVIGAPDFMLNTLRSKYDGVRSYLLCLTFHS